MPTEEMRKESLAPLAGQEGTVVGWLRAFFKSDSYQGRYEWGFSTDPKLNRSLDKAVCMLVDMAKRQERDDPTKWTLDVEAAVPGEKMEQRPDLAREAALYFHKMMPPKESDAKEATELEDVAEMPEQPTESETP